VTVERDKSTLVFFDKVGELVPDPVVCQLWNEKMNQLLNQQEWTNERTDERDVTRDGRRRVAEQRFAPVLSTLLLRTLEVEVANVAERDGDFSRTDCPEFVGCFAVVLASVVRLQRTIFRSKYTWAETFFSFHQNFLILPQRLLFPTLKGSSSFLRIFLFLPQNFLIS
jgi:hypothetical protein